MKMKCVRLAYWMLVLMHPAIWGKDPQTQIEYLIGLLVKRGWVERAVDDRGMPCYRATAEGIRVARSAGGDV